MAQLLIIDDHPGIVHLLDKHCTALGHHVATAMSGQGGLRQLNEVLPDVVLVDLKLGDMTGLELMKRAKAEGCTSRFVFITGCSEVPTAVAAMKAGAVDYITKPIDLACLEKIIDSALEFRGSRRASKLVIVYPNSPKPAKIEPEAVVVA